MSRKSYSILRDQEYVCLKELKLRGQILDIGGSKKSGYHELLGNAYITTANIDPAYGCDLVFDIQERFPISDEIYDYCIALNVLEHIYKFENVFKEVNRILKYDGSFIFATPFMYQIHGSPDDYFRYTKSAIIKLASENGFTVNDIQEIGLGLFSLFFQVTGGALPGNVLKKICKKTCLFLDRFLLKISKRYRILCERIPLGYFVIATKRRAA